MAALEADEEDDVDDGLGTQRLRAKKAVRPSVACLSPGQPPGLLRPSCWCEDLVERPETPLASPVPAQLETAEAVALTEALQEATDKDLLLALAKRKAEAPQPPPAAAAGAGAESRSLSLPHPCPSDVLRVSPRGLL